MITPELIAEHNLSDDEYARIVKILGREPNLVELGIFSAMWSEHCSYKSSRVHLKTFPTSGPRVLQGPGENAGIVDIGGGLAVAFKMESHNHPSFIEPYQGAATGVGGILRDIFTRGAPPIASCLELFETDAVVGIQDMGAAGLTSSAFEMAGRAGSGVELDLSKVPVRESGMTPYEIMLSESQERMLLVARRDRLDRVFEIF